MTPEQEEKLKKKFDVKNFDINAILRGAQLTVVGGQPLLPKTHLQLITNNY